MQYSGTQCLVPDQCHTHELHSSAQCTASASLRLEIQCPSAPVPHHIDHRTSKFEGGEIKIPVKSALAGKTQFDIALRHVQDKFESTF